MLTQDRLKALVKYDPGTGLFSWRVAPTSRHRAGDAAGYVNTQGYVCIGIAGKRYLAHRLAFLYMTGEYPAQVDHEDTDRTNNVWRNLRPATHGQNQQNQGLRKTNSSGVKGVSWHRKAGKWAAEVWVSGRKHYLGLFASIDSARAAADAARATLHGNFARHE